VDAGRLISDLDLGEAELVSLLELTKDVKANPARYADALRGQILSLLFEKPSLRTRLTFEVAAKQMGGDSILSVGPVGDREPIKDVARNLDRWTNCIVARTFSQETIEELARWSSVPVINALSDLYHPCQALADVFTLKEHFGDLPGLKLVYVGDGNNVAHSLMLTAARLGVSVAVATPPGYEPSSAVAHTARGLAEQTGARVTVTNEPAEVLQDADAVYTDVWASMGQEGQKAQRLRDFAPYQVDEGLMKMAKPSAIFMHCLPAKRGEEVVDAVIESPQSVVFDQAENRLHTQKALLLMLLA
jgi:ornithine carbamoyltransferase